MMDRARWSVPRTNSGEEGARRDVSLAGGRSRPRAAWAGAVRPRGRAVRRGVVIGRGTTRGAGGFESGGAEVDGVALGLGVFGVAIVEGVALG